MTVRKSEKIKEAGEELGKSLAKVLHSAKYEDFHDDYTNLIEIMAVASNTAIRIIEEDVAAVRESS
jgi:hypothetical protein